MVTPRSTVLSVEEATVPRSHYDSHDRFRRHLEDFVQAYNFDRRLKTLRALTSEGLNCET